MNNVTFEPTDAAKPTRWKARTADNKTYEGDIHYSPAGGAIVRPPSDGWPTELALKALVRSALKTKFNLD